MEQDLLMADSFGYNRKGPLWVPLNMNLVPWLQLNLFTTTGNTFGVQSYYIAI